MKYLNWQEIKTKCRGCGEDKTDEVPREFEDDKLELNAVEFPIVCTTCSRTRFYAVRKKINVTPNP